MSDAKFCGDCGGDSRGSCTCSEECETCGGDGTIEVYGRDADDIRTEPCPDCDGAGRVDDGGPSYEDRPLPTEDRTGAKESPL